jgi:hypothetical protein
MLQKKGKNKAKKQLLNQTIEIFLNECILYNNPKKIKEVVDSSFSGIGTTIYEKVSSTEGLETILKLQKEQTAEMKVSFKSKTISNHISTDENTAIIAKDLTMYLGTGTDTREIYIRISTVLEFKNDKWLVVHWHASLPDTVENEGDTFGLEALKQKTFALEKLIAERTQDLVKKNRELEIEAALERVRSKAMAMHKTSDLQEVIHIVHQQLLRLNIRINGGSFIVINEEIEDEIICWGSGGTANTSEEVHIPKYDKPFCTNLINGIKDRKGFFTEHYSHDEKKEFFNFLLKHEPWSLLDSEQKVKIISSTEGYTRSCCMSKYTSIFIINHIGIDFSHEDNNIVKRFGKVFEQKYTRFLDLQKA